MSEEKPVSIPPITFTPAVGRIVHLTVRDHTDNNTSGGDYPLVCKAAIITRVIDAEKGLLHLCWFDDNAMFFERFVKPGPEDQEGAWHSPERV